jgi:hypothetical protein
VQRRTEKSALSARKAFCSASEITLGEVEGDKAEALNGPGNQSSFCGEIGNFYQLHRFRLCILKKKSCKNDDCDEP